MTQSWQNSLKRYHYPVCLKDFRSALKYPSFFNLCISGDRDSTIHFENYFRLNAKKIEPWFEVVFWKLYSQSRIRNQTTENLIRQLQLDPEVNSTQLLEKVNQFMNTESREDFNAFRKLFRFRSNVIAIVATFPAFLRPDEFPMIDTRVAKWVNMHYQLFNTAHSDDPQLIPSEYANAHSSTVLTMDDFNFYIQWIHWTRNMAEKLTSITETKWRARDVEMAVFTAWGNRGSRHPNIRLNQVVV